MYLTNKLIEINEDKNVVNNPTNKGKKGNDFKEFTELINSTKATKVIAGIPRRNEYLAASFLSHPESIAIEIVAPERDTPGIIANDWAIPIKKVCRYLWFFKLYLFLCERSAKNIIADINNEEIAIDVFERKNK